MAHPQVGSQETPAGGRVGVKDVVMLSRVFFPKTAQELVSAELPRPGKSPQSQAGGL